MLFCRGVLLCNFSCVITLLCFLLFQNWQVMRFLYITIPWLLNWWFGQRIGKQHWQNWDIAYGSTMWVKQVLNSFLQHRCLIDFCRKYMFENFPLIAGCSCWSLYSESVGCCRSECVVGNSNIYLVWLEKSIFFFCQQCIASCSLWTA